MIDIHSHLLPGIDDGAHDIDMAVVLAKIAVTDGITHMVCTPHIHPGRYDNTLETISAAKNKLKTALKKHHIALAIAAAAEVRFSLELMDKIRRNEIPFLGKWQGKDVLLLEFPHHEMPFKADRLTAWLLARDIVPLIAHPERNRGLLQSPVKLKPFIRQGCLLQVTASSLVGTFGEKSQQFALDLLQKNLITVLASDAHNDKRRPPILTDGFHAAADVVGTDNAYRLVFHRPWQIVQSHF